MDKDFPETKRAAFVDKTLIEKGIKIFSKPQIAYSILDLKNDQPIIDPNKRKNLRKLYNEIINAIFPDFE